MMGQSLDNQEPTYRDFARWCGCAVPDLRERIYSIDLKGNGEDWTATVGRLLSGSQRRDLEQSVCRPQVPAEQLLRDSTKKGRSADLLYHYTVWRTSTA